MSNKRPTIRQLEYFCQVAEMLSFRQAAAQLNVSQPTLTAQISALEATLDIPLFERSRMGTWLSAQGRDLLPYAKQVLGSVRQLQEASHELTHGQATTFKLGVPPTLGPYLLPHILPDLHRQYDQLKLFVREAAPKVLVQNLIDGVFDLILTPLPFDTPELIVEPLFTEPLKFVVPINHRLSHQSKVAPREIRGERVLTLEEHHHFHRQVQDICERLGATVLRDFEGTSLDTLRQMVVMGIGVAFLPGLYVHSELHKPEALHVCELAETPIMRQHALIWRPTSPSRVFFRELAGQIRNIIRQRLGDVVVTH